MRRGSMPTSIWRLAPTSRPVAWQQQPAITGSLRRLAEWLHPDDRLLVYPPQRNDVHWLLGTQTPGGYGWGHWEVDQTDPRLRDPELRHVVILDPDPALALPDWTASRRAMVVAELRAAGFVPSETLPGISLWSR